MIGIQKYRWYTGTHSIVAISNLKSTTLLIIWNIDITNFVVHSIKVFECIRQLTGVKQVNTILHTHKSVWTNLLTIRALQYFMNFELDKLCTSSFLPYQVKINIASYTELHITWAQAHAHRGIHMYMCIVTYTHERARVHTYTHTQCTHTPVIFIS